MIKRTNPLSLDVVASDQVAPDVDKLLDELEERITEADDAQAGFIEKQAKLERLRMGHRRPRNIPWEGCSNISIPLADGIIRRSRPGFASLILDADPIAVFDAQGGEDLQSARELEHWTTWLLKKRMKISRSVVLLIDYLLSRGHAFTHEGWDYRTSRSVRIVPVDRLFQPSLEVFLQQAQEQATAQGQTFNPGDAIVAKLEQEYDLSRDVQQDAVVLITAAQKILQGEKFVRVFYNHVERDQPQWLPIDPVNLIKPVDQPARSADFVAIVHYLTPDDLTRMARDGVIDAQAAAELKDKIRSRSDSRYETDGGRGVSARDEIRRIRDKKSRVTTLGRSTSKPEALVYQVYALLDINGDEAEERVVYWYAPQDGVRLALYEYPFPFEEWPITTYRFSNDLPRDIDQRGIPELVAPFQKLANAFENAWIDAATLILAPMIKQRQLEGEDAQTWKWRPGGSIPFTGSPDDVQVIMHDLRVLGELLTGQNVAKTEAENYVGIFDAAIRSVTQRNERRTAREVTAIQSLSDSIFGLDAKLFSEAFAESLNRIIQLWVEFGPPEVHFRVEGRPEPITVRREDLNKNFDVSPAGTPANTQKAIMLQNIQQFLQLALQPQIAGSGLVDVAELLKQYLRMLDFPLSDQVVRNSEEAAVVQHILQASAQLTGGEPLGVV